MKKWILNNLKFILILIFLVLITYANALNNAFVSDDIAEIAKNPNISDISTITTRPFNFIRIIFYWISFNLGGLNPLFFRLINYFFHLGSVLVVFALLSKMYTKRFAFFVAAIFAVHPSFSEAVIWISGGTYPQYTFFFLLSLLFYIFSKERKKYYWFSILSFLLALMSHSQMSLPLFVIFPIYELSFGNLRKNLLKVTPFFLLSLVYLGVTFASLPERTNTLQSVHYQEGGLDNPFIQIPIAISSYFELIFWPQVLTLYHSELAFGPVNFAIRAVVTLALFAIIGWSFIKNKQIFFWLSLFLVTLSPTLTPFKLTWIVAERYLYLASLGIIIPVMLFMERIIKKIRINNLDLYLSIVIVTLFIIRTFTRNIDWKNEDNLWIATGKTSPSSPNTHNNLGDVYGRWGDKQKALEEFQTAIALKPNYADAYHNLANTYREVGEIDKALENYHKAIEFNPKLWQSYQNIASIYFQDKDYDKTLEYMEGALKISPQNIGLYSNLGIVYLYKGDKEKAKEIFNQVLAVDPQNQFARQGLVEANK